MTTKQAQISLRAALDTLYAYGKSNQIRLQHCENSGAIRMHNTDGTLTDMQIRNRPNIQGWDSRICAAEVQMIDGYHSMAVIEYNNITDTF